MNEMALLLGQRRPAVSSSLLLDFFCGRRFRSCGSDRGLSDRPLDPFGFATQVTFGCAFLDFSVPRINTRTQHEVVTN